MAAASKGWFNLEQFGGVIPETQYFEGDSAFSFLGLTRKQRLYGFIICGVTGFVLSLLGVLLFVTGSFFLFAFLYGIGTIVSLLATGFVIGFFTQLKLMFKPVRIAATIIFLASIAMIFMAVFLLHLDLLTIIFVILEFIAYTWYNLSYIPYARTAALKMIGMGG